MFSWLARSASAFFRMRSKKRIGDRPTDRHDTAPLTPSLKFDNFRRNSFLENETFSTQIGEIEAHSFFENWPCSTKIGEIEAHFFFEN